MKPLSSGSSPIVVRTDFSDPVAWDTVRDAITAIGTGEEEGFQADVLVVDDPSYEGATLDDVLALVAESYSPRFVMVVDDVTIHGADHPVLVVSLDASGRGETFRAVPASIQAVENNLSIANMDWEDFAGAVDADGIFRGF